MTRLTCALIWACCSAALAVELPANTRDITSLTPEQAQSLIHKEHFLALPRLAELPPDVAAVLAQHGGGLELSGLTNISKDTADKLATSQGRGIDLSGLASIQPDIAQSLGKMRGWLKLDGLKSLQPTAARLLAQHKGQLCLNGLTSLPAETAGALAEHDGELQLNGVAAIDAGTAEGLGRHQGLLRLHGLRSLSAEAANGLARHKGGLVLTGLEELRTDTAASLAASSGGIFLRGLKHISNEVAFELARHKGDLGLEGLTALTPEAAKALANHDGKLYIWSLGRLTPEAATAFASRKEFADLSPVAEAQVRRVKQRQDANSTAANQKSLDGAQSVDPVGDVSKDAGNAIFLSDLQPLLLEVLDADRQPEISWNGVVSPHGLWAHPLSGGKSALRVYAVPEKALKLAGAAAINDTTRHSQDKIEFRITDGDGNLLWETGEKPLKNAGDVASFVIPVNGKKIVKLEASMLHKGQNYQAHGAWLEPRFILARSTSGLGITVSDSPGGARVDSVDEGGVGFLMGLRDGDVLYKIGRKYAAKANTAALDEVLSELDEKPEPCELMWRRVEEDGRKSVGRFSLSAKAIHDLNESHRLEIAAQEAKLAEVLTYAGSGLKITRRQLTEMSEKWQVSVTKSKLENSQDGEFCQGLDLLSKVLPPLADALRVGDEQKAVELINQVAAQGLGSRVRQVLNRVSGNRVYYEVADGQILSGEEIWEVAVEKWAKDSLKKSQNTRAKQR